MSLSFHRAFRDRAFVLLAVVVASAGQATVARAQVDPSRLRSVFEVGTSIGGTWLDGTRAPEVTSGIGVSGGLGVQRSFSGNVVGAVNLRVLSAAVSLSEAGMTWNRGRTLESSLLASISVQRNARRALRPSMELAGGITRLSGPRDIVPFKDAANIAPTAEVGLSLRRGEADADASRREFSVYLKYSVLQVRMAATDVIAEDGTLSRILIGVRATR
jgi:hypothetical protein